MPKNVPSTQEFISIETIANDVVFLRDGGLRQIILVSGLNLDLMSEEERDSILGAYQRFLNSLDFTIQFIVHSRKFNINKYIDGLEDMRRREVNELLRNQIFEYKEFIKTFVEENNIMTKMFLVVVQYNPVYLKPESGWLPDFLNLKKYSQKFSKAKPAEPAKAPANDAAPSPQDKTRKMNVHQLKQRTDQVVSGIQSIGLRAVPLNTEELTELFYNFYNPEVVEKEKLAIARQNESESESPDESSLSSNQ